MASTTLTELPRDDSFFNKVSLDCMKEGDMFPMSSTTSTVSSISKNSSEWVCTGTYVESTGKRRKDLTLMSDENCPLPKRNKPSSPHTSPSLKGETSSTHDDDSITVEVSPEEKLYRLAIDGVHCIAWSSIIFRVSFLGWSVWCVCHPLGNAWHAASGRVRCALAERNVRVCV